MGVLADDASNLWFNAETLASLTGSMTEDEDKDVAEICEVTGVDIVHNGARIIDISSAKTHPVLLPFHFRSHETFDHCAAPSLLTHAKVFFTSVCQPPAPRRSDQGTMIASFIVPQKRKQVVPSPLQRSK